MNENDDELTTFCDSAAALVEGCRLPVRMQGGNDWPLAEIISIKDIRGQRGYYVHYVDFNKRLDEWVSESWLDTRKVQFPRRDGAAPAGTTTPKKTHIGSGGGIMPHVINDIVCNDIPKSSSNSTREAALPPLQHKIPDKTHFGEALNGSAHKSTPGVFPYHGKSHFFVFEPFLRELARRGHDVTVISHFPLKQPVKNYTDISLAGSVKILEDVFPIEKSYATVIMIGLFLVNRGTDNCRTLLENTEVQKLWKTKAKFDVVLVEQFNSDCSLGLAYKLGAPVVGMTSHAPMTWHYNRFGIPYNPSYVPFRFFGGGTKPTLYQRIESTIFNIYFNTLYKWFCQRVDQNTLAEYFDDIPPLEELGRDIKFLLLYKNFILFGPSMIPENVKEVGGYHVAAPKPLSDDLKTFIEEAEHGVIYISFGSMLKAASTPREKIETIIAAMAELPQRVVWKWEEPVLPGNPKNIYISNWLPQNDILAHPKVLAFYSHCGLLGTTEAIHHGVPMVGMPIFGDQPSNAAAVEESGLGVQVQVNELTKERLLQKFKTVLDPEFRRKVKLISKAWHDRPLSAMDSAVFWTDFAARNSHFTFRSPAADVPLYQYLNLDILAIFTAILLVISYVVKSLFTTRKTQPSIKPQKKSKKA